MPASKLNVTSDDSATKPANNSHRGRNLFFARNGDGGEARGRQKCLRRGAICSFSMCKENPVSFSLWLNGIEGFGAITGERERTDLFRARARRKNYAHPSTSRDATPRVQERFWRPEFGRVA